MKQKFDEKRKATIAEGLAKLPRANGEHSVILFEHGSLLVKVSAPRGTNTQQPHSRDEVYIVAQGTGEFVHGETRMPFAPGDFLFVAAGEDHHFENFTDDLAVWVLFYGPEGGEANVNE